MTESEAKQTRPPLTSNDTFDAPELVGSITRDGFAALQPGHDLPHFTDDVPRQSTNTAKSSDEDSVDSSAAASDEDVEDYDDVEIEKEALVSGSQGGYSMSKSSDDVAGAGLIRSVSDTTEQPATATAAAAATVDTRRKSIQIRLEKTGEKGRYILTADDPDIRSILRKGLEREEASKDSSKKARTIRDYVFTRQFTTFDRQNPLSSESPFHGFFTLFWLAMVLMFVRISAYNWKEYGSIIGNAELIKLMFSREVIVLGLTDGVMCVATAFGLGLQKAILNGYLSWTGSGWIIQNLWQTFYLAAVIGWTVYREWPWTHTIFIVLHCMVFLMKQHSYSFYNGYLSVVYKRRNLLRDKLHELRTIKPVESPLTSPQGATGAVFSSGTESTAGKPQHRRSMGPRTSVDLSKEQSDVAHVSAAMASGQALNAFQMQAMERIIQDEIRDLEKELKGKCPSGSNAYPRNLNLANYADWVCLPTLVYELEYPRQDKINWSYVAEKTLATFGVLGVMQVISQAYIYPPVAETVRMKEAGMNLSGRLEELPWTILDMLFPLLLEQLLAWYLIWECVLNVLAELTCFADRGFYGDWWNSVSWDQYARDWNRPVHNFLLRHVYHSSISAFHLSKSSATFVTFLLSALVHELVMACMFKKVRGYLFVMQILQIPLVSLSRTKLLKGRNLLGNVIFWVGLFVGPSVLTSFYLLV